MLAEPNGLVTPARLDRFFSPRSIAVVGASETSYWGRNVFGNLERAGFAGPLHPVNPKRQAIFGVPCLATLRDLAAPVDLVYIAAPTDAVASVLDDAAAAGIRNAVVIAAGFSESGAHDRQAELVDQAERHGIILLGPNCPGFVNIAKGVSAYGQDVPTGMKPGPVSIVLQSGALATVVLKLAKAHGIGLSKLVCMGNEAVIQTVDVLDYLIGDPDTRVIAMFLEQIKDGGRFLELARRALRAGKAIVVLKAGRTPAGRKSALAHTGAVAGDEAVIDAALRQAGVTRVRSLEELIINAGLFASGVRLRGPRMGVVTASGGACDIIADRASDEGLEMPAFSPATTALLREYLPRFATVQNPLDTAAVDTARETGTAAVPMDVVAEMVSKDANVDFVLYMAFNVVPQTDPGEPERSKTIERMAHVGQLLRTAPLPLIPISLSCMEAGPFARENYDANGIFMLGGMEFGLSAIGNAVRWEQARAQAETAAPPTPPARAAAAEGPSGPWSEAQGRRMLESHGVPLVPAALVRSAEAAVTAAEGFGYPVVLKICAATIAHKSDIGGVALNLGSAADVRAAFGGGGPGRPGRGPRRHRGRPRQPDAAPRHRAVRGRDARPVFRAHPRRRARRHLDRDAEGCQPARAARIRAGDRRHAARPEGQPVARRRARRPEDRCGGRGQGDPPHRAGRPGAGHPAASVRGQSALVPPRPGRGARHPRRGRPAGPPAVKPPPSLRVETGVGREPAFTFTMDGAEIVAYPGETIAAALQAADVRILRITEKNASGRGVFCGMGVCFDCLVTVDGTPHLRACLTRAEAGARVVTQDEAGWRRSRQ